jgi:1-acyl-sn-glycerol-3-phosphate acyltransferase
MRFGFHAVQLLARGILTLFFGLKIRGRENVPQCGPFILASNHKSFFDPPIVGSTSPREVHFAAKKELFAIPLLGRLIKYLNSIPVKRSGFDRDALVRLGEALDSGGGIIIFPEGTRYLDEVLHLPKAGVGMLALKHAATIVPVYVSGSTRIRRQLIARKLSINFGKPFQVSDLGVDLLGGKEAYLQVAVGIMQKIAELGGVSAPELKQDGS